MQDIFVRGTVLRVFKKGPDVLVFLFKTDEQYPFTILVKKFRKDVATEQFVTMCDALDEGSMVVMSRCRMSSEKAMEGGQPVKTTTGRDVFQPVLVAGEVVLVGGIITSHPLTTPADPINGSVGETQIAPQPAAKPDAKPVTVQSNRVQPVGQSAPAASTDTSTALAGINDDNIPKPLW